MSAGYGQDVVSEKQAQAGMTVNFPDVSGETVSIQTDSGDQEVGMEFVLGGLVVVGENIE